MPIPLEGGWPARKGAAARSKPGLSPREGRRPAAVRVGCGPEAGASAVGALGHGHDPRGRAGGSVQCARLRMKPSQVCEFGQVAWRCIDQGVLSYVQLSFNLVALLAPIVDL